MAEKQAMLDFTLGQRVRHSVFQFFLASGRSPVVEELMREFGLSRAEVEATLDGYAELAQNPLVIH